MNSLRDPGLAVALGLAVLVCDVVARRIRIAPPVVLLVCGALLGFVPALRSTHLPPSAWSMTAPPWSSTAWRSG
jgi:CPA1 family monovalent cation:H+ antiporter